jgi:hypothetical protein
MNLMMDEAIRKICQLFLVASSSLQNENVKLKTKVEQMTQLFENNTPPGKSMLFILMLM